jgi:hypothetical protein
MRWIRQDGAMAHRLMMIAMNGMKHRLASAVDYVRMLGMVRKSPDD